MLYRRTAASAGCVALFACLMVAVATLVQGSLILRRATPATVKACSDLQQQLGREKVVSNRFDFQYLATVSAYYNQLQAKRFPACVVYPTEATDVVAAVKAIRKADARFAIKAGGHQFNQWSSVDQGVQIDFRRMLKKTYDPVTKIGFYEPGNRWRDNYKYFGEFGYAPVGGRLGGVGSGLALGGGLSYLSAQYGLACDSFVKLDVVLPDGTFVQATRTNEYKDLFMTLQGGANIIGVVTGFHVQLRPVGSFTSGNIFYSSEHTELLANVTRDFTNNNKDPKAAVITTVNRLFTPDLTIGLDEFVIQFLIYDGDNPGDVFKAFEAVPHLIDTRKKTTYFQTTAELDIGTTSSGVYHARVVAIRTNSQKHTELIKGYRQFGKQWKGSYFITTLDYQPVPRMLSQASRASGGNALALPDEPFMWINLFVNYNPSMPADQAAKMTADFDAFVDAVPNDPGLPLFLNDAGAKQKVLQSYGNYAKMQAAKRRYDPQNYFSTHQDGPSIEV